MMSLCCACFKTESVLTKIVENDSNGISWFTKLSNYVPVVVCFILCFQTKKLYCFFIELEYELVDMYRLYFTPENCLRIP